MMARRARVLKHLTESLEKERNDRLAAQQRARATATKEARTLEALESFRKERLSQRRTRNSADDIAVNVAQQVTESRFDSRLVEAIDSQSGRSERATAVQAECQAELQTAQRRLSAMNVLLTRHAERVRRKAMAGEQKLNDELAANKSYNARKKGR